MAAFYGLCGFLTCLLFGALSTPSHHPGEDTRPANDPSRED